MNFYTVCQKLTDPLQIGCAVIDAVMSVRTQHREIYHDTRRFRDYRNRECNAVLNNLETLISSGKVMEVAELFNKHALRLNRESEIYRIFSVYHAIKFLCQTEKPTEKTVCRIAKHVGETIIESVNKKIGMPEEYQKEKENPKVEYLRILEGAAQLVRRDTKIVLEIVI